MALNRIEAWLRIRDRARFSKDARESAREIRDIGDAAKEANSPTKKFGAALDELGKKGASVGGRTRLFGLAIGTVVTGLIAAIPVIVGVGGAIVALAASLSMAVLALGALGAAAGGVLILPLLGLAAVAAGVVTSYDKVSKALEAYRLAVHAYGRDSKQAETAQKRLNGTVKMFGGPDMLAAVRAVGLLSRMFKNATAPAVRIVAGLLGGTLRIALKLLPTVAQVINSAAAAVEGPLKAIGMWIASPIFQQGLLTLSAAFNKLAGPLIRAALFVLQGFFQLAVRLSPLLIPIASGIENMAAGFARWTNSADFGPMIANLQSWWNLMKAVAALLWEVIKVAAPFGKLMVDALTGVVKKWTAWMQTAEGQQAMKNFFRDAVKFTISLLKVTGYIVAAIFKFGRWALPGLEKAFEAVIDIGKEWLKGLDDARPFIQNVVIPLIKGLVKGTLGSLIGALKVIIGVWRAWMIVLGFVGSKLGWAKGIFEVVGQVIGFVFGGEILKAISMLGKLSVVLKPVAFLAKALYQPIRLVGWALGFVFRMGGRLVGWAAGFIPRIVNPIKRGIATMLSVLAGAAPKFFDAGKTLWLKLRDGLMRAIGAGLGFAADLGKAVANVVIGLLNSAIPNSLPIPGPAPNIDLPNNPIPTLATGGVVTGAGSWITGEAGPELNTLRNGRVTVQPLPAIQAPSATGAVHSGAGKRTIVTKVFLRGRQIAEAVADEAEDQKAAR